MSLLSSVLNKLNKREEGGSSEPAPARKPEPSMTPNEMTQRFAQFVMIQAQNILLVLGKIPTPEGETIPPNIEAAKIYIEQLEMIAEKTAGNLSKQESRLIERALEQVRMAFVETTGGTPHTMIPSRPMRGIPPMDDDEEDEDLPEEAPRRAPEPAARQEAPRQPAPQEAPASENKKKFVKKYD